MHRDTQRDRVRGIQTVRVALHALVLIPAIYKG